MHSRNSYTGKRRVYAGMFGDTISVDSNPNSSPEGCRFSVSDPTTFGCWRLENPEEMVYNAIKMAIVASILPVIMATKKQQDVASRGL